HPLSGRRVSLPWWFCFFFQAEGGIRDGHVTGVQTCALPISAGRALALLSRGDREVLDRRIEERHEAGAQDEPGKLAKKIREGLLRDIERIVMMAREAIRQTRNAIAITQVKRTEGVGVAGVDGGDQLGV